MLRCFTQSINFETKSKSLVNDGFAAEFFKHLDVNDSRRMLGIMNATSRAGISMIFYIKKGDKKDLDYKICTTNS